MRAAADAAKDAAIRRGGKPTLVIGVTVLTSMHGAALKETGIPVPVQDQVLALAELARSSGLDGVVASPQETSLIRERLGRSFTIVTPGIRGGGATVTTKDDQERTMGPREAIEAGADYLVVGRPIIGAPDPRAAAERIAAEMAKTGVRP